jgi:hypothetical protein
VDSSSRGEESNGVRVTRPAIRSAAPRMSSIPILGMVDMALEFLPPENDEGP